MISMALEKNAKFQVFSRSTGKLSVSLGDFHGPRKKCKIPGVFQEYRETICFSRSFPGSWKNISKFQEYSRSTGKLSVFLGDFQDPGKIFQNSRSFPGILE